MGRKTIIWTFQVTNKSPLTWENLDMAKKGNLKRETESLLIATQNNAIRTNYIKARIDETLLHSQIWVYEIDIFIRIRKTFTNVHKHIGIQKHSKLVQIWNFYYHFEFKIFRHEERDTISFYADFSIWPPPHVAPPQTTGLASVSFENRLPSSRLESQLHSDFISQLHQRADIL